MVKIQHFTDKQIGGLYPEKTLIKLFNHHPKIKETFDVQFRTLKEFFADKINYLLNTKEYILNQINKKYHNLKSFTDIELGNIKIEEIEKKDIEEKIKQNIKNSIGLKNYINNAENTLAIIKGNINFKSPLYLNIEEELEFSVYINQSNFDILSNGEINYTFDINYGLESAYNPSGPQIDIYFTENEKLGKIAKQKMFEKLNNEIKDFIQKLDLNELLKDNFRKTKTNFSNLPDYKEFIKNKKRLIEQINNGEIESKYLYDGNGSKKFNGVTKSKDYYLIENEASLLKKSKEFLNQNIIDLGSGNGEKALNFLKDSEVNYFGIDSSIAMLLELAEKTNSFQKKGIERKNINIDFSKLEKLRNIDNKTLLFLGSTLGNFGKAEQVEILSLLKNTLSQNDNIILALDLENSDEEKLLKAYSSNESKEFIFSLFKELGFNEEDLELKVQYHQLIKNVETGVEIKKDVKIQTEYGTIEKKKGDYIECISSEKFTENKIEDILKQSGLKIINKQIQNNYGIFTLSKSEDGIEKVA